MELKLISFNLPPVDSRCLSRVERAKHSLLVRAKSIGDRSPRLNQAIDRLKSLLAGVGELNIAKRFSGPIDVKAFAKIFAHEDEAKSIVISSELIQSIENISPKLSQMSLRYLIEGYLQRYDQCLNRDSLEVLGNYIQSQLALLEVSDKKGDLRVLATNRQKVFIAKGPATMVEMTRGKGLNLQDAFKQVGLESYSEGRYFQVCRYLYYLEELRAIPVGEHHRVLEEVQAKEVYTAPGMDMPTIGLDALSILIDRSKGKAISDEWLKVVLDLAGDPRVPDTSASYRQWWSHLGLDRVTAMRGWLSRLDLKLFLRVLEDYGRSSGNTDLQRMYPSRKRFLEGLLEQGLVTHSRLYINPSAENFLKRSYKNEDLPQYAKVKDTYRSMIYLNVGGLHMIEGSHSFKLWIFPQLPEGTRILDPCVTQFHPMDLSSILHNKYLRINPQGPIPAEIRHMPQYFAWQRAAINYLRDHGIKLDVEKLFSKQDYREYMRIRRD